MKRKFEETEAFKRFWNAYDYKIGKQVALKVWHVNGCEEIADQIIASLPAYDRHLAANTWLNKKHASTFLNGAHWEDEYPTRTANQNRTLADAAADIQSIYARWGKTTG